MGKIGRKNIIKYGAIILGSSFLIFSLTLKINNKQIFLFIGCLGRFL